MLSTKQLKFTQPFTVQTDLRKTGCLSHSGFQCTFIALIG